MGGCVLIAPAALDPREDSDAYDSNGDLPPLLDLPAALPAAVRERAELEARFAAFRALLSLPDAFGLPTARRIAEDRDVREAVLNQYHDRMRAPEHSQTVDAFAKKYSDPVPRAPASVSMRRRRRRRGRRATTEESAASFWTTTPLPPSQVREFPDDWDTALLNVYRADQDSDDLSGRELIEKARLAASRNDAAFLVVTGDDDRVVPVRSSAKVAHLLRADPPTLISQVGHIPMDEKPRDLADAILAFVHRA